MNSLVKASKTGNRLEQLVELRNKLATAIDNCESMRDLAALSRQYRETIREIEEIEGDGTENDEIKEILGFRSEHGKSGAVRKDRTEVR